MEQKELLALIDKYLANGCTPEEARIVEEYYASIQHEENNFYKGDKKAINASAARSLKAIRSKLGLKTRVLSWQWMSAAACIILLIAVGTLKIRETPITYATKNGEVKNLVLPDSTHVWLNAGSTLKYVSNKKTREIWLEGEAFFDVAKNINRPFMVHGGQIKIQVLGTSFMVSAYPGAIINSVMVHSGKVQVSDQGKVLGELVKDQRLEYTIPGYSGKILHISGEKLSSWKNGRLSFVDMPMQDIAIHLQNWYGVQFKFKDPHLKNVRFTASFNNNISLKELLTIMSELSHVNYTIDENTNTVTYY